jgi:NADP-dependent 3-hydroxy acid dehydrogenase YdfG
MISLPWAGGTAVITGAGSGLGAALARVAAAAGMTVVLADVRAERLAAVAKEIDGAVAVVTDVTDLASVQHLAEVAFEVGDVRLLVNNAGVAHLGLLWEEPAEDWHRLIDVNLNGVYHGIRAFVPRLIAAGAPAWVLNTASVAGLSTGPFHGWYQVSKHAVVALSQCLAADIETVGAPVHVAVALPGPIATRIFTDANLDSPGGTVADEKVGAMRTLLAEQGMTGQEAASILFEQMAAGRFWVTPHPAWFSSAAGRRAEVLLAAARTFDESPADTA